MTSASLTVALRCTSSRNLKSCTFPPTPLVIWLAILQRSVPTAFRTYLTASESEVWNPCPAEDLNCMVVNFFLSSEKNQVLRRRKIKSAWFRLKPNELCVQHSAVFLQARRASRCCYFSAAVSAVAPLLSLPNAWNNPQRERRYR